MSEYGRLIDGDELLELLWRERVDTRERIASIVERMPTIEPERKLGKWIDIDCPNCGCKIHIDPSAQPERKSGKWIEIKRSDINPLTGRCGVYVGCSECGAPIPTDSQLDYIDESGANYCINCGADMTGGDI